MSACFVTRRPMDIETAIELLQEWGCTVEPPDENYENEVTVVDPDGNCLHLTCIEDETETPWVRGKAYGLIHNDPTLMVYILDMAGEGEEDYEEIISQLLLWPEEAENEAMS